MNSIPEIPEIRARAVPLTVASYEEMTARGLVAAHTELIHEFIVEKMSKSPLHARITDRLCSAGNATVRTFAKDSVVTALARPEITVDFATVFPREEGKIRKHSCHL